MRLFFHIVKYKILSSLKSSFDFSFSSTVRNLGSALMYGTFAYVAFRFAYVITDLIITQTHVGVYLYHQFISILLFVFFVAVNLGNIIVAYATLYKSPEVGYLMTKPLPHATVFLLKFFDNFFYSSTTLFLMGFAVLLGYGSFFGHSWQFYVSTMLFVFLPFMLLAACFAVIILMVVMKVTARFGFRTVMAGLFLLYFVFIFLFFRVMNPIKLVEQIQFTYPHIDEYLAGLSFGFLDYLPNALVARYLYYSALQNFEYAIPYGGVLFSFTVIMVLVLYSIGKKYYYKSWLVSLAIQPSTRPLYGRKRYQWFDFRRNSVLQQQTEVLLKKEFLLFFREPSQWIHALVMIVLVGIFVISTSQLNLSLKAPTMQLLTYMSLFAFSGFMVTSLALRFIFPTVELEGKALWTIRTAPLHMRKWVVVKLLYWIIFIIAIGELIAVATHIPFLRARLEPQPLLLWIGTFTTFWVAVTAVFTHFGFGAYFARYTEKNPIRAASTQGATLTFLGMMLYLIAIVLTVLIPLSGYFQALYRKHLFDPVLFINTIIIVVVLSFGMSIGSFCIGYRALRRDFV
ncbi:MAG: hypothetical protein N3A63_04660 [Bacteroidetes bacterium]|nr:hypothetical protein [Bacteroidota bacterium]